jgi:malonate transporter MadL subunit
MTEGGVNFWSAMYIPIVVAMAAQQDVVAAASSGWMAISAGVAAVAASFAMIPVLARFGRGGRDAA